MKQVLFLLCILSLWGVACQSGAGDGSAERPTRDALVKQLETFDTEFKKRSRITADSASLYLQVADYFSKEFKEDTLAPKYLFQAGRVANAAGMYKEAIAVWGRLPKEYFSHPLSPQGFFLQAFTYETHLNNITEAQRLYNSLIASYPDDEMAAQAKVALEVMHKTPEELVEEFKKKNKE